ncbi:MAG TPA: hypothetical protein VJL54_00265 [Nitrososphaera sp.]|nr:hypothetical protein [Nitrososphaera sp.]
MIATSVVHENTNSNNRVIPPSVLMIGKKHASDYIAPGLLRLSNTGKVVIKATGSLSIVTAVDVAEMIKRDVANVVTETIALGTDSLVVSTGESKRMSCIEIQLSKIVPPAVPIAPAAVQAEQPKAAEPVVVKAKKKTSKKKAPTSRLKKKKAARKK